MSSSKAHKILVVEDEADVMKYLETLFLDNDFEVETAKDGDECIQKALSGMPDLITLDISMPGKSGVKAFRTLQETEETKNIPVIIITGITGEFKKFIHTRRQVDPPVDYFEKPIQREKLLERVRQILGDKEAVQN